jgi:hypothetical protein
MTASFCGVGPKQFGILQNVKNFKNNATDQTRLTKKAVTKMTEMSLGPSRQKFE